MLDPTRPTPQTHTLVFATQEHFCSSVWQCASEKALCEVLGSARCSLPPLEPEIRGAWCAAVCCQVADFAGLARHRAIGWWTKPWSCRRWTLPDVRVACQVVAIASQRPCRQSGRWIFSHSRRAGHRDENRVTSALSRRSWPWTAGRILVQRRCFGSSVCQPSVGSSERGGER